MNKKLKIVFNCCLRVLGEDMTKRSRKRHYVMLRNIYFQLAREMTPCTLDDIGKPLEKNHATVLYALKTFYHVENDDRFLELYKKCRTKIMIELETLEESMNDKKSYMHSNINLRALVYELQAKLNKIPMNVKIKYL